MEDLRLAARGRMRHCVSDFHCTEAVMTGRQRRGFTADRQRKGLKFLDEALDDDPPIRTETFPDVGHREEVDPSARSTTTLPGPDHLCHHGETPRADATPGSIDLDPEPIPSPLGPARLQGGDRPHRVAEQREPIVPTALEPPYRVRGETFDFRHFPQ